MSFIKKYVPYGKQISDLFISKADVIDNPPPHPENTPEHILEALDGLMPMNYSFGSATRNNHLLKGYGKNPHVYAVISFIAKKAASLPYVNMPDYIKPQKELFITFISLLATGNAFLKKETSIGHEGNQGLEFISTLEIEILHNDFYQVTGYKRTLPNGINIYYEVEDIIHIKMPNVIDSGEPGLWGLSSLHSLVTTYESSNNIKQAEAAIFKNFGVIGILTNDSEIPIVKSEKEEKNKEFKLETAGAGQFGKILLSNIKLRFLQLGMTPTTLKMIDANIEKLRTICSGFGVNSVLFNDQVSSSYNNNETATRNAYTDAILPLTKIAIETINEDLGINISINESEIIELQDKVQEDSSDE